MKSFFTITFLYANYSIEVDKEFTSLRVLQMFYRTMKNKDKAITGYTYSTVTRFE